MALQGNEIFYVQGIAENGQPSPVLTPTTTSAVAALSAALVATAVTVVGNTTLSAAAIVGGLINRTGPTAAYTDTTDTAANIVTALGQFNAGETFQVRIKNATTFQQTLAAGTGVTLPGTILIPPLSMATYIVTVGGTAAAPTVVLSHVVTEPIHTSGLVSNPQAVPLTTVGAGTILAAALNTGFVLRSGPTAAFTDTTDTAANIIAGVAADANIVGSSTYFSYVNNSAWPATIQGGTGVTINGQTVIPANSIVMYLMTYTAAGAVTLQAVNSGFFPTTGTFTANGATAVVVAAPAVTANSNILITLKTVGGTPAGAPYLSAITAGTGFSVKSVPGDISTYTYTILG